VKRKSRKRNQHLAKRLIRRIRKNMESRIQKLLLFLLMLAQKSMKDLIVVLDLVLNGK